LHARVRLAVELLRSINVASARGEGVANDV
jgi:hypothetical protein